MSNSYQQDSFYRFKDSLCGAFCISKLNCKMADWAKQELERKEVEDERLNKKTGCD